MIDWNTMKGAERKVDLQLFQSRWKMRHELGQVDIHAMIAEYEAIENQYKQQPSTKNEVVSDS